MKAYYAIGMAGHIDHGKTTLTRALTGVDTDQLKEEKERGLSIEPGFAPFLQEAEREVSLIDVPGHERFIRQMIAGVAGVDFVILVIAADEGVMPQTEEHLQILSLLGIERGLVVLTKIDQVDEEWLEFVSQDIQGHLAGSFLAGAPIYPVDSLSGRGLTELRQALEAALRDLPVRDRSAPFRLPIDHVFTVKGQGLILRGTIYDGEVRQGDELRLLPQDKQVRVRQLQSHRQVYDCLGAGQRAALNVTGLSQGEIARGDVLVKTDHYRVSKRLDLSLKTLKTMRYPLRQRQAVKLFVGTTEVMGKIIFFDRNLAKAGEEEEILCQFEADSPLVVTRGDRLILRRPTPAETIGGGWVLDAQAEKHRFGEGTMAELRLKQEGTAAERVNLLLDQQFLLGKDDLLLRAGLMEADWQQLEPDLVKLPGDLYSSQPLLQAFEGDVHRLLTDFHQRHPLRAGIDKAEAVSRLEATYPARFVASLLDFLMEQGKLEQKGPALALPGLQMELPDRLVGFKQDYLKALREAGVAVPKWSDLGEALGVAEHLQLEFYHFFLESGQALLLEEDRLVLRSVVEKERRRLQEALAGEGFSLQEAREVLGLSRKNLIPLLELFDACGWTRRKGEIRLWLS